MGKYWRGWGRLCCFLGILTSIISTSHHYEEGLWIALVMVILGCIVMELDS